MSFFSHVDAIKQNEGEIVVIDDFLSTAEIEELLRYSRTTKNVFVDREDGRKIAFGMEPDGRPVTDVADWEEPMRSILADKLKSVLGDYYIDREEFPPHFFDSRFPIKAHADTGKTSDAVIYKQILLPLDFEPDIEGGAHTVFFKNRWYREAANFRHRGGPFSYEMTGRDGRIVLVEDVRDFSALLEAASGDTADYAGTTFDNTSEFRAHVKGLITKKRYNLTTTEFARSGPAFPKDIWERHLTHHEIEDLGGLEFWQAVPWKRGIAVIWDRTVIHCSSNFRETGIASKTGIALFTSKPIANGAPR